MVGDDKYVVVVRTEDKHLSEPGLYVTKDEYDEISEGDYYEREMILGGLGFTYRYKPPFSIKNIFRQ